MAAALRAWGGGTITNGCWKRFQHQMDSLSQTRVLPRRLVSSWILTCHQPHWVTSVRIAEEIHNHHKNLQLNDLVLKFGYSALTLL